MRELFTGQKAALDYSRRVRNPALFMPMRAGKCAVVIRRAQEYTPRNLALGLRALVVAPNSALGGWADELEAEGVKSYCFLEGPRRKRIEKMELGYHWYLLNKEGWRSVPEIHSPALIEWDLIVVDESAFIKNPRTGVTQFFLGSRTFKLCPHRWVLTGMPIAESPLDLYTQMAWLNGSPFGCKNYWQFRAKLFEIVGFKWYPTKEGQEVIQTYLARYAFILSKERAGLGGRELLERRRLRMSPSIRKIYETAHREFILEVKGKELGRTMFSGARWQWLRQLCGGFAKHKMLWRGKMDELFTLLNGELKGERVVVWFTYNDELYEARYRAAKEGIRFSAMLGETKLADRRELRRLFAAGRFRVFFIQQAVADTGLDLSAADVQIFYSIFPGLFARKQCRARLRHPKKRRSVLTIDLVTEDSVDEDVVDTLIDKNWTSETMMRGALRQRVLERGRKWK